LGLARPRIAFLLFRVSSSLKSSKSILTWWSSDGGALHFSLFPSLPMPVKPGFNNWCSQNPKTYRLISG
jgi:hypothetical protein